MMFKMCSYTKNVICLIHKNLKYVIVVLRSLCSFTFSGWVGLISFNLPLIATEAMHITAENDLADLHAGS